MGEVKTEKEEDEQCGRGGGGGGAGRTGCSDEVQEEREEMEEKDEEREDKSEDFLSGTGGFGLRSPSDLVLGREEMPGDREKEYECDEDKGEVNGR